HSVSLSSSPISHISPLSLHDALPISDFARTTAASAGRAESIRPEPRVHTREARVHQRHRDHELSVAAVSRPDDQSRGVRDRRREDRKSTRLNSSHLGISYAVFCLKKK